MAEEEIKNVKEKLSAVLDELSNYKEKMECLSREDFSYYLSQYQYKMDLPLLWLPKIYANIFADEKLSFEDILVLAKNTPLADKHKETGWYYQLPLFFCLYMEAFWDNQIDELKGQWNVDPLDFAIMTIEYQQQSSYAHGWAYHTINSVLDISSTKIEDLLHEANEVLEDGDSVKVPVQFHTLLTINKATYLNKKRIKEASDDVFKHCCAGFYKHYMIAGQDKLKKALKKLGTKPDPKKLVDVSLSVSELTALTAKSEHDYVKRQTRKPLAKYVESLD